VHALDGVTLELHRHEVVGLIGPNGAGKTTVFNVITGVYAPTRGRVLYDGRAISGMKSNRIACGGITRMGPVGADGKIWRTNRPLRETDSP